MLRSQKHPRARWLIGGLWPGAWRRAQDRLYRQCRARVICQLRTLQKRPFKKGLGQKHISPVLSAQLHPCPAPGSLFSEGLTQFLPSALPLEVTSEKLAVARAHLLRLTWQAPISVACLPSSLSRPHHPCSVFRAAL